MWEVQLIRKKQRDCIPLVNGLQDNSGYDFPFPIFLVVYASYTAPPFTKSRNVQNNSIEKQVLSQIVCFSLLLANFVFPFFLQVGKKEVIDGKKGG